jgi:hypothetical protein
MSRKRSDCSSQRGVCPSPLGRRHRSLSSRLDPVGVSFLSSSNHSPAYRSRLVPSEAAVCRRCLAWLYGWSPSCTGLAKMTLAAAAILPLRHARPRSGETSRQCPRHRSRKRGSSSWNWVRELRICKLEKVLNCP